MKIYLNFYNYFYFESSVKTYSLLKNTVYFQLALEIFLDRNFYNKIFSPLTKNYYDYSIRYNKKFSEKLSIMISKYMIKDNYEIYRDFSYELQTLENTLLYLDIIIEKYNHVSHYNLSVIPSELLKTKEITQKIIMVDIKSLLREEKYNEEYIESVLKILTL
jgi:hypothetical protein